MLRRLCDEAIEVYMQMNMAELLACQLRSIWPNMSGRGPCYYSRDAQSRPFLPCRPLVRCSHFVQVWTSHLPGLDHPASDLVNTHTLGREQGLTFWRPQTPSGYAALGDCVTGGISQPTFQVHTIYVFSLSQQFPQLNPCNMGRSPFPRRHAGSRFSPQSRLADSVLNA